MGEFPLIAEFVLAVAAALVAGMIARALGQPSLLGYLLVGVLAGPAVLGLIEDVQDIQQLAQFGVAFLMFALGTQFSIREVRLHYRLALVGALLQTAVTIVLVLLGGLLFGLSAPEAALLGIVVSDSSTIVMVKVLSQRGELDSFHGRLALAFSLGQDVLVIPLVIILPHLGKPVGSLAISLVVGLAQATGLVLATYLLGTRGLSWLLDRVAQTGRELFLLSIVLMAVGIAVLMERFGLSLALGAFIAGLIVGQSDYGRHVQAEVVPLRDIFATLFFIAAGMLVDISYIKAHPAAVLLVVAAIVTGKALVVTGVAVLLRYPIRASIQVGFLLANIGEFAFVLAHLGLNRGVASHGIYSQIVAGAVISIILSPLVVRGGSALAEAVGRFLERKPADPRPARALRFFSEGKKWEDFLTEHVVICGYDGVGRNLAAALDSLHVPYVVVELNPAVVWRLQRNGVPVVSGDAANPEILSQARLARARAVAVTIPDVPTARAVVAAARKLGPEVEIVMRRPRNGDGLGQSSAEHVIAVHPDFETSQEFVRHIMRGYGLGDNEIIHLLSLRRVMATDEAREEAPSPFREPST